MRLLLAVLTALVLALAACGGDDDDDGGGGSSGSSVSGGSDESGGSGGSDEDAIRAAIATFAESGPEACDVLTDEFVERLFGGPDECVEQASEGEGSDLEVDKVEINGDTATAEGTLDGETATITLEKVGDDWKISRLGQLE